MHVVQHRGIPGGKRGGSYSLKVLFTKLNILKGVFAKNERGYRLNAIKKRF